MSNINKQLENLYLKNIDKIAQVREKFMDEKMGGPLLLYAFEKYQKASPKVLVIGQQTNGWADEYKKEDPHYYKNVKLLMNLYKNFRLEDRPYKKWSYFWKFFPQVEKIFVKDTLCAMHSNINRFDHNNDRPYGKIKEEVSKLDFLLIEEIKILKPDICIFAVGYTFDKRLERALPNISFNSIDGWWKNELCMLSHPNLPLKSFRMSHPKRYLKEKNWERLFSILNTIKRECIKIDGMQ